MYSREKEKKKKDNFFFVQNMTGLEYNQNMSPSSIRALAMPKAKWQSTSSVQGLKT